MAKPVPRDVVGKVRKLAELPKEARQGRFAVSITRLTVLKNLCREAEVANRFVTYLAGKILEHVRQGRGRTRSPATKKGQAHLPMMAEALPEMEAWLRQPIEVRRERLRGYFGRMRDEQNEYKHIKWGAVRLITDQDLLLFEYALNCLLHPPDQAGHWAYQTARHYAERFDSRHGTGLTPASASLVQDIADFWVREFGLDPEKLTAPANAKEARPPRRKAPTARRQKARFTHRQGQFLAFIHLYRKLNRHGPAEVDMVRYFRITPPAVHSMVVKLEELGFVTRQPGVARSVRVAIPEKEIPDLEEVEGPPC